MIPAKSIQNDRYIINNSIFEYLALAETQFHRNDTRTNIEPQQQNLFQFIDNKEDRIKLINIAQKYKGYNQLDIYTDGSLKDVKTDDMRMACAFIVKSPIETTFSCAIENEPSSTKVELMAVILAIMICPKDSRININTDSKNIITIFEKLITMEMSKIKKERFTDLYLWSFLIRLIRFFNLTVTMTKVKAHSDDIYNNEADKEAKLALQANCLNFNQEIFQTVPQISWNEKILKTNFMKLNIWKNFLN